jgi:hypothetical protein
MRASPRNFGEGPNWFLSGIIAGAVLFALFVMICQAFSR